MLRRFIKVIATGALGLALSTTSVVPPPQPALAAEALTKEHFDEEIGKLTKAIKEELPKEIANVIKNNNKDLAEAIAVAISPHHPVHEPHPTPQMVVVQKPVQVSHRPHWCCRPPPPPCPPWGW
jgi:hypothetical protein